MELREPDGLDEYRRAVECHNRAWQVGYRGIAPPDVIDAVCRPTEGDALESFREAVAAETGPFLVAEREGRVLGYVRTRIAGVSAFVEDHDAELVALSVDPARWRRGIGSALFDAAVDRLPVAVDGIGTRVLAENHRGRSFLETCGLATGDTVTVAIGGEDLPHAIYRGGVGDGEAAPARVERTDSGDGSSETP